MKHNPQNQTCLALAILAVIAWCGTARADLGTPVSAVNFSSWDNDPNGNSPFYEANNLAGTQTAGIQPAPAAGAVYTVLSETFTIAPGDGLVLANGNTNYTLTGLGLLISGSGTNPLVIHLFDVTTNISGGLTVSGSTYNFSSNGDLLGGGSGLSWSNNAGAGEQQVYLPILNGPATYDQIVLGAGHTYALEVWTPVTNGPTEFNWYWEKTSPDPGGQAMGSVNGTLATTRETLFTLHDPSSPVVQKMFALALYGSMTSNAPATNTSTNIFPTTTNYIIDAFNAYGYGPVNPYVGTNDYSTGGIEYLWTNWYGAAWVSNSWDPTVDASGNSPNSGSLKITANFSSSQYLVSDYPQGIAPPLNGEAAGLTSFQCDVLFAPGSCTTLNGSVTNYGHLQFGMALPPGFSGAPDTFGSVEVPVGTTNWTHVNIPISAANDPNLTSINDVVIKIDGTWYPSHPLTGSSTLWVDNIKFVGPAAPPPVTAPVVKSQKGNPGLRIFAASTINTYDRQELDAVDQNQSWIWSGVQYPVTYQFTLQDFPVAPGMQCHIFLIPIKSLPAGNAPTANEYVDYQASNNVWLQIAGGGANPDGSSGYTANLWWKTNDPNANAANQALVNGAYVNTGNQNPVGTWTLTFNSANSGTMTPPGVAPQPFTINDPNIAADFGNQAMLAIFGLQPNSMVGEGTYIDYASISVTGVQDGNEIENFVTDYSKGITALTGAGSSGLWDVSDSEAGATTAALQLVNATTPLWVYWSLPDAGFGLGVAPLLPALPQNDGNQLGNLPGYVLPEQYNGYYNNPIVASRAGGTNWTLIPNYCLPSYEYPNLTNAFFILQNPPPAN